MEEPRTASGAGDAAGIPSPYRILLVDDQPMMHEALRRILSGADDLELHCCAEGARALSRAEEIRPAVILQDLIMPDMDGLMLVRLYRSHGSTRDVPVVVLSSRDEADTKAGRSATEPTIIWSSCLTGLNCWRGSGTTPEPMPPCWNAMPPWRSCSASRSRTG